MTKVLIEDISYLNDPVQFEMYYMRMPQSRKDRIDRMRFQNDQCLSLGAGILLEKALEQCGLNGEYELASGRSGKPYFPEIKDRFRFSLSHSGTMAMCAYSCDMNGKAQSIGCDIQEERETDLKIAERFFHPDEYEMILKEPDLEKRISLFFRLWTLKESWLKACGSGILLSMKEFRIQFDENGTPSVWKNDKREPYIFTEIKKIPGYAASYCIADEHDPEGF